MLDIVEIAGMLVLVPPAIFHSPPFTGNWIQSLLSLFQQFLYKFELHDAAVVQTSHADNYVRLFRVVVPN
jgi:hypothetical protein